MGEEDLKRTLLVTPDFPPKTGGISSYLAAIFTHLSKEVVVVTPYTDGPYLFPIPANLTVLRPRPLLLAGKSILLSLLLFSIRVAARGRVEVVHCGHLYLAFVGHLLRKLFGIPWVTWVHGMELFHPNLMRIFKAFLLASDRVVTNSKYTRDLVSRMGVAHARVRVVHPPVDVHRFSPSVNPDPVINKHGLGRKRVLLTVARLAASEQYKGHDQVIKALPGIAERVRESVYLIVGDGDDRGRLEKLADRYGVRDRVIFAGRVPDELLPSYYAACDLFIMPSRVRRDGSSIKMEGFGIVFLEAAACGKPSIGGRSGGIPDAVLDGVTGLLVDPEDAESIGDAVVSLLTDRELMKNMGQEGRKRVLRDFTPEAAARKVESLTEELLGRSQRSIRSSKAQGREIPSQNECQ